MKKWDLRCCEDISARTSNAPYADGEHKPKVTRGLPRYFTGFYKMTFVPARPAARSITRISRNRPAVRGRRRQEAVSTSAENALWCRDFAAGKVILSIDIKGLA
jgi:hypothetical protein